MKKPHNQLARMKWHVRRYITLARLRRLPLRSNLRFSWAPNMMSSQRTRQFTSASSASNL